MARLLASIRYFFATGNKRSRVSKYQDTHARLAAELGLSWHPKGVR